MEQESMNNSQLRRDSSIHPSQSVPSVVSGLIKTYIGLILRYVLPFIVLVAGILITLNLLKTGPRAKPMPPRLARVPVETTRVDFAPHPTRIHAMGVVKASRTTDLKPQVSGQVITISDNLLPGGRFAQGDTLLQLDPSDYLLVLKQQESAEVQAKNNLLLEEGQQLVVQREYNLLGEAVTEKEKHLMLRQPQLSTLLTEMEIVRAKKELAELNLARTSIKAPYNGFVQTREVNLGTWVSTSAVLATLVGSDSYWVEVSVPEEQLRWIKLPSSGNEKGSAVKIYNPTVWGKETFREGSVIQLLPALEAQGRMARILIEIDDPMALDQDNAGKPGLLIESFVRVEIEGKDIPHAVELPRDYLRNGNQLWVFDKKGCLAIREVSVGFKNRDSVLVVSGIEKGEEVVVTDIPVPVNGLRLRHLSEDSSDSGYEQGRVIALKTDGEIIVQGEGHGRNEN